MAADVAATVAIAVVRVGVGRVFQYQDFDNTKTKIFNGVQYLIISMRWLSMIEGCFFTCYFPADQKVRCALNHLRSIAKD